MGRLLKNAAATDRYYARQNRTVKVVAFTAKVCDRFQPQCARRVTGEFNKDNLLERVITWFADPGDGRRDGRIPLERLPRRRQRREDAVPPSCPYRGSFL
jgi:hypothetical protein